MSNEYLEELENTRDALYRLTRVMEPGTGWTIHEAYNDVKAAIKAETGKDTGESDKPTDARAEYRARVDGWQKRPRVERERFIMDALGERHLTIREVTKRLGDALPEHHIYQGNVTGLISRMWKAGELDREPEMYRNRTRYRYFRKVTLEGPIAELDRAFHDGEAK